MRSRLCAHTDKQTQNYNDILRLAAYTVPTQLVGTLIAKLYQ